MDPNTAKSSNDDSGTSTPAAPAKAAVAAIPSVPDNWPGAFGVYKFSKKAVQFNLGTIALLWIIDVVVGGGFDIIIKRAGGLVSLVFGSLVTAAMTLTLLASVRGKRMEIGEAFSQAMSFWLKMIGLTLLVVITVFVSILLLIIPFFFVLPRVTLAYYYLVDKQMGVMDAYKASWHATKGHIGKVWGIIGVTILMALLMITIIGIPFSIYFLIMYSAAIAVLYEFINKSSPAAAAPVAASPTVTPPKAQ